MARAETESKGRCTALTEDGERCSRPASDGDFCYQHDESDPTVSETETESSDADTESSTETDDQSGSAAVERAQAEETTDPADVDASDVDADTEGIEAVLSVRRTVQSSASELIGRPLSSVIEIEPTADGWRGVVEVIERSSIPDTQDILGRYEIVLSEDGVVEGYRRLDRYRRDDTSPRE